ncbi:MAG: indole-3-glycerol-phosphate synthase TrpC, partial [Solirubrobacterales bacterium]
TRALESGAEVIGNNNRNLDTGEVVVATTYELMPDVPTGTTVVSESGISQRDQLAELERIGVDGALIGESLMRSDDPETLVREFAAASDETTEHELP